MSSFPGQIRLLITAAVLVGGALLLNTLSHGESVISRRPLRELPYHFGAWTGEERLLQGESQLVGSDYANRLYSTQGGSTIELYVGYYPNQKDGGTIHSPKDCLPGAGWEPIRAGYATIPLRSGPRIVVNEYMIQKDQSKQLVFYWYQGRSRVITGEYWNKFWMVADAISRNRTDSALIRMNTSVSDEKEARSHLVNFTQVLFPYLDELIPN